MAVIIIPAAFRQFTNGVSQMQTKANTVEAALNELAAEYKNIKKHLFKENNTIKGFVNVYVNQDDIRFLNGLDTPVSDTDTILLIPAIMGG